ncbi:unnamed protein product [Phyllotreta striolata]|uniref:Uncharacterized protein n=1 Tax=Phyllotreta striolata TaxID=444603 RepID=A0A9N9TSZ9_PHYSR|nr:unnamed protein product [Phyllotreta striolata]
MERVKSTLNNVADYMEKDSRGVQITCYSLALFGLTVAVRKVRPFSKFRKPLDVPNHFIKERRELEGCVRRIDPNGSLLIIDHKPLVRVPLTSSGELPVKISGIKVSGLGTNWLQSIVAGQNVTFVPVSKEKNFVECKVLLKQDVKDNKQQTKERVLNIGECLVKVGFAVPEQIEKPLSEDSFFLKYYTILLRAEKYALRKQLGFKYYAIPTKKLLASTANQLALLFNYSKTNLPKLVIKIPKVYNS